ncbi:MAG: hypothetical protein HeimC2_42480 [Candidatus Heimdallarchaeota archaeon LC_2]|nr:MAG: hypothetical protein HeimC2_42480 [Candidatus Heimdallarchaeota archaeon LC_2]
MYKDHPSFTPPKNLNSKIWRYMDFAKFVSLLENQSLYVPRADKLGDSFEGSMTHLNKKGEEFFFTLHPELHKYKMQPSDVRKSVRKSMYISCWHLSEYESMAMWDIYTKSNNGIAIQSDYSSLKECLHNNHYTFQIGMVNYINYETDGIRADNLFNPFLCKRRSYEHEKELRAISWWESSDKGGKALVIGKSNPIGISIKTSPTKLIKKVYINPNSPNWILDTITKIVKRYNYNIPVIKSQLDSQAIF